MTIAGVLAILVVTVAAPLNWFVTIRLWRLSRKSPDIRVLRERAIVSLALALIVTIFAIVFVNNELGVPPLDVESTRLLTRGGLLVLSVAPSVYWLRLYRRA